MGTQDVTQVTALAAALHWKQKKKDFSDPKNFIRPFTVAELIVHCHPSSLKSSSLLLFNRNILNPKSFSSHRKLT